MYSTGLHVDITRNTKTLNITISNSLFKELYYRAIHVKSKCGTNNTNLFIISNCTFHSFISTGLIKVELSKYNKYILFKKCTFINNYVFHSVAHIQIAKSTSIECIVKALNSQSKSCTFNCKLESMPV